MIAYLALVASVLPFVYLYWRILDRRLTDIPKRQEWFRKNHTGDKVSERFQGAEIRSIHCHPPNSKVRHILRYLSFDYGRTQITVLLSETPIKEEYWSEIVERINKKGVTVVDHGPDYPTGGSYITVEIEGFDAEELESVAHHAEECIHEQIKLEQLKQIPDY